MQIDYDFWNDINIKEDLLEETYAPTYNGRNVSNERKKKNVFIYIYSSIINFINKIQTYKNKMENFF